MQTEETYYEDLITHLEDMGIESTVELLKSVGVGSRMEIRELMSDMKINEDNEEIVTQIKNILEQY